MRIVIQQQKHGGTCMVCKKVTKDTVVIIAGLVVVRLCQHDARSIGRELIDAAALSKGMP